MMTASYAQKDNWILYPTRIDFDAGPGYSPAGFSNPNLTQPYAVENSVFDDEGNLLFYIQNERIYDASGTSVATFSSAGVYGHENRCIKVSVEVGNDCGSLEDFSYIEFTDNIPLQGDLQALRLMEDGRHKGQEVSVFPNPFNRELTLAHEPAFTGKGVFRLINMAGQTVYHQVLQAAPAQTLQLPHLPAGIYLYTWQSDGETTQGKLIRK